jgi:valyl-tRNA synthetase
MKGHKRLPSVHLADWPNDVLSHDEKLRKEMEEVKAAAEIIHFIRKESKIKSRQPLAEAAVSANLSEEACAVLAEEINVDKVVTRSRTDITGEGWQVKDKGALRCGLNTVISEALRMRGQKREIMRHINDLRKLARLTPEDTITLFVETSDRLHKVVTEMEQEVRMDARVKEIVYKDEPTAEVKKSVTIDGDVLHLGLRVV